MTFAIVELTVGDVDRVGPLFRGMVEHHRAVTGDTWPVRDAGAAWSRRRAQYVAWLSGGDGRAWMLAAASDTSDALLGYAVLTIGAAGPSWDMADVGELESLAVAPEARSRGVGTALIAAARERLAARGVVYWGVGVVEANADAVRLYEREGFGPYYRSLLGRVVP